MRLKKVGIGDGDGRFRLETIEIANHNSLGLEHINPEVIWKKKSDGKLRKENDGVASPDYLNASTTHGLGILMPYDNGTLLKDFLAEVCGDQSNYSVQVRLGIIKAIGLSIADLNKNRVIHGDVSPNQFFLHGTKRNPRVSVIDFGAGRIIPEMSFNPPKDKKDKHKKEKKVEGRGFQFVIGCPIPMSYTSNYGELTYSPVVDMYAIFYFYFHGRNHFI